jgi:serine/threonine protein kinase
MSELIGKTVGQYQIIEQIGAGGMATIFKAYQPSIDRYVAVKILPSQLAEDENFVKRFAHEARAIAALEHPHILPVHDFGTDGDLNYMVMRYVKGGTLTNVMGKPVPDDRIVQIVGDVAKALAYAHDRGVVHRDIKPSNILIDERGEVLLTDFGIAKMVEGSQSTQLTAAGSVLGTPAYMAPEQAQGKAVDGRSDIYSLGVVLYELLTGRPPYEAETPFAVVLMHINDPLPPPRSANPDISEPLERVVLKAMAKDPDQRFETAGAMAEALQNAQKETEETLVVPDSTTATQDPQTLQDTPATAPTENPQRRSLAPLLIVGGAVVLLLCLLAGGGLIVVGILASSDDTAATTFATGEPTEIAVESTTSSSQETVQETEAEAEVPDQSPPDEQDSITSPAEGEDSGGDSISNPDSPQGEIIFADDFDSDENGWFTGQADDEFGNYETEIVDGRYKFYVTAASEDGNFGYEEPFGLDLDDFVYSADFTELEYSGEFGYGLVFRSNTDGDYYLFEIDRDGFIVMLARAEDEWDVLVDYTETNEINPDGPNQLMVVAAGPRLTFFINEAEVAQVEDDTYERGSIGLVVDTFDEGGEIEVGVESVTVLEVDPEMVPADSDKETAAEEAVIVFAEYFDSDENGWATGEFENEYSQNVVTIVDGRYTLDATSMPGQTPYVEKKLPNQDFSNFILSVEATPGDSSEHYSYGLAFRENSAGHTYAFEVGNDGLYGIFLFEGEWVTLKDWSSTDAVKAGQTNELTVVAEGDNLTFFVNEQELTTIEDDALSAGTIGLVVEIFEEDSSASVDFDNLIVTALPR